MSNASLDEALEAVQNGQRVDIGDIAFGPPQDIGVSLFYLSMPHRNLDSYAWHIPGAGFANRRTFGYKALVHLLGHVNERVPLTELNETVGSRSTSSLPTYMAELKHSLGYSKVFDLEEFSEPRAFMLRAVDKVDF